jgi:hypothetical protein
MPVTNAGRDHIAAVLVRPDTVTAFTSGNAYIGVGSGTTAFAATQTALGTPIANGRLGMDSSYPTVTSNAITFRSTFGTGDANDAWQEWGVFNASASGTMLNRKVESLGTKPGSQTWQFTVTITLTVPAT